MNEKKEKQVKEVREALENGKGIAIMVSDFVSKEIKPAGKETWEERRYYKSERLEGITVYNSVEEVVEELERYLPVLSHELQILS